MTVGTRSVLLGAHCFFLHPWFVAYAWWKLYGFKPVYIGTRPGFPGTFRWFFGFRGGPVFARLWDPRLWVAFFVHDLGYIGKPNMDGEEGEHHPVLGARIMSWLFDAGGGRRVVCRNIDGTTVTVGPWGMFTLLHSRYFAKRLARGFSRLCVADKYAIALTPGWLYLPMVRLTGELAEYLKNGQTRESPHWVPIKDDVRAWHRQLQSYMREWVAQHKEGGVDTWTSARNTKDPL